MLWYRNWATRSPCASLRYSSVSRPGRTCGIAAACRCDKETEELQPLEWDKPWPWPHLFAKVLSHVFGIQDLKCGHVGKPPGHDVIMSWCLSGSSSTMCSNTFRYIPLKHNLHWKARILSRLDLLWSLRCKNNAGQQCNQHHTPRQNVKLSASECFS